MPDGAYRTNSWIGAGVIGGIPTNQTLYTNIVTAGAANDFSANIQSILQTHITACPSNKYIFFPAGTYRLSSDVTFAAADSGVVLRGTNGTHLVCTNNAEINIGPGDSDASSGSWLTISSGATKGSTSVTLGATTGIAVGELVRFLLRTNEVTWGVPWSEGGGSPLDLTIPYVAAAHYVSAIAGNVITITPPLTWDFTNTNCRVMPMSAPLAMAGIEDMNITIPLNSDSTTAVLYFQNSVNCWLKNVQVTNTPTRGAVFSRSCHDEIRHCYFSNDRAPGAGGGDCITYFYANTACLVTDSIFYKGEPCVKYGDGLDFSTIGNSGNVFSYNFIAAANTDSSVHWLSYSANHGYHNWGNLMEGNIIYGYPQDDGYHGSSSHMFVFRNWVKGYVDAAKADKGCMSLCRWSYTNTIVGNVMGDNVVTWTYNPTNDSFSGSSVSYIYKLGYPNMGNNDYVAYYSGGTFPMPTANAFDYDRYVAESAFIHANYDFASNTVYNLPTFDTTLPSSMYLSSKPDWWPSTNAWPAAGSDKFTGGSPTTNQWNPAYGRYTGVAGPLEAGANPPPVNLRITGRVSIGGNIRLQ